MTNAGPAATTSPVLSCFVANAIALPMSVIAAMMSAADMIVWLTENTHINSRNAELAAQIPNATNIFAVRFIYDSRPKVNTDNYIGGYCSNFGRFGSIKSHGCASHVKKSIVGLNQLGSSKLPAVIPTKPMGRSSFSPPVIREPHSAQKPRLCLPPARLGVKW